MLYGEFHEHAARQQIGVSEDNYSGIRFRQQGRMRRPSLLVARVVRDGYTIIRPNELTHPGCVFRVDWVIYGTREPNTV
jgi:hypothetical protein